MHGPSRPERRVAVRTEKQIRRMIERLNAKDWAGKKQLDWDDPIILALEWVLGEHINADIIS